MRRYTKNKFLPLLGILITLSWSCQEKISNTNLTSVAAIDAQKLFAFQIFPLLESKCFACHGEDPEEIEGDFDMRTLAGMLKGGETGKPALMAGHPESSPIYQAVLRLDEDFAMPPKENDRLDEEQLEVLEQWIKAGAPWLDDAKRMELIAEGGWDYKGKISVKTSGGLSDSWTNRTYNADDLWAFYPVKKVDFPTTNIKPTNNPIDAFVNQKLEKYGLQAAEKRIKEL